MTTDKELEEHKSTPWPGRWVIKLTVDNFDNTGNQAHIRLWRWMDDAQVAELLKEVGRTDLDNYEESQVMNTFNTEEVEKIKRYFSQFDNNSLEVEQADMPVKGFVGCAPFADMSCGELTFPELEDIRGVIYHFVTPDNYTLEWDQSSATLFIDADGIVTGESDYRKAMRELEEKRQSTRQKLQDMISD